MSVTATSHMLIERAKKEGTPLIDGNKVTFVWVGDQQPQLIADFTNWESNSPATEMAEVAPGVWAYSHDFEADAYIEYTYLLGEERQKDPFNSRQITNGMGKMNHYFAMPGLQFTKLVRPQPGVPQGKVTTLTIADSFAMAGKNRPLYLYQPPVDYPVPLLLVLDGKDYYTRAKITTIVDNLIAQKRIEPVALAMIQNGANVNARFIEYMCSEATIGFLLLEVLQRAQAHLNLLDITQTPGAYGILGASMGGLMALYTGLRVPEVFGKVISQSGAFGFDLYGHETVVYDLVRRYERQPLKIWMDVGRYEWLLDVNQKMHNLLVEKGYAVTYREYNGGHNYTSWRNELVAALESVFPGEKVKISSQSKSVNR